MPTRFNLLVATKVSKVSSFGLENDVITNEWALAACKIYVVWWWKPTCSHCNKSLIVMPIVLANSIFQNIHSTFDQFGLIPHSTENHPNPNPYSYQKIVQLSSVIISCPSVFHRKFPPFFGPSGSQVGSQAGTTARSVWGMQVRLGSLRRTRRRTSSPGDAWDEINQLWGIKIVYVIVSLRSITIIIIIKILCGSNKDSHKDS